MTPISGTEEKKEVAVIGENKSEEKPETMTSATAEKPTINDVVEASTDDPESWDWEDFEVVGECEGEDEVEEPEEKKPKQHSTPERRTSKEHVKSGSGKKEPVSHGSSEKKNDDKKPAAAPLTGKRMEASIVADIKKEFIRSPINSKKGTTATDKKGRVDAHESQEKKHSRTKTADSTKKSGEQKSSAKGESGGHHSPQALVPKRTEALPEITQYVDSLIGLEYDVKKYTCFYCNNVCRWRQCLDLAGECDSSGDKTESAVKQGDVDKYNDNVIIGAGHVVEVCDVNGEPRSWICILCNAVCNSVELLLGHLTSFLHIQLSPQKMPR